MSGVSISRVPRPGNSTGQTSTSAGKPSDQVRKIEAPVPAYGKQNRRRRACGFGLRQAIQESKAVVMVMDRAFLLLHFLVGVCSYRHPNARRRQILLIQGWCKSCCVKV